MKNTDIKTKKYVNCYGVFVSEIENMMFSKYISNQGLAMNTFNEKDRKMCVTSFLCNRSMGVILSGLCSKFEVSIFESAIKKGDSIEISMKTILNDRLNFYNSAIYEYFHIK